MLTEKLKRNYIKFLKGLPFPATREEIIRYIRDKGAPPGAIDFLGGLKKEEYEGEKEIIKELNLPKVKKLNSVKLERSVLISQRLPQFEETTLLVIAGRQEASLYRAKSGVLSFLDTFKVPTPSYSDNEGHFKVRARTGVASSGSVREMQDEKIVLREFLQGFRKMIKNNVEPRDYENIYIFVPGYVKNEVIKALPSEFAHKDIVIIEGNYFKTKLLDLVRIINNHLKTAPLKPKTVKARKVLKKAEKARRIIKEKNSKSS